MLIGRILEMKYSREPYSMTSDEMKKIETRMAVFINHTKTRKAVHLVLITASGINSSPYSNEFQNIITGDDLFT